MNKKFSHVARFVAMQCGHAYAFIAALALIIIWLAAGPYFGFADPLYQLIINTVTTIITFLMVFLLQHAQNHDTLAIQIKLDELITATNRASNEMQRIEDLTEEELRHIQERRKRALQTPRRKR
jgi:low affinity Fe/Cu permease